MSNKRKASAALGDEWRKKQDDHQGGNWDETEREKEMRKWAEAVDKRKSGVHGAQISHENERDIVQDGNFHATIEIHDVPKHPPKNPPNNLPKRQLPRPRSSPPPPTYIPRPLPPQAKPYLGAQQATSRAVAPFPKPNLASRDYPVPKLREYDPSRREAVQGTPRYSNEARPSERERSRHDAGGGGVPAPTSQRWAYPEPKDALTKPRGSGEQARVVEAVRRLGAGGLQQLPAVELEAYGTALGLAVKDLRVTREFAIQKIVRAGFTLSKLADEKAAASAKNERVLHPNQTRIQAPPKSQVPPVRKPQPKPQRQPLKQPPQRQVPPPRAAPKSEPSKPMHRWVRCPLCQSAVSVPHATGAYRCSHCSGLFKC